MSGWVRRFMVVAVVGALSGVLAFSGQATAAEPGQVTPVASVDLTRYVGHWYQIAAVPAIYEAQCAKDTTADYLAGSNGTVGVTNKCVTWWGGGSTVRGVAKVDNAPANSELTVSFVKLLGRPIYLGGTNYVVIGLDAGYRWAVVTDPDRVSGFVLSRTAALSASDTTSVRAVIAANGFAPGAFRYTVQDGGASGRGLFN